MIEIQDDVLTVCIWFANIPGVEGDWMGCVSKKDGQPTSIKWRYRYYNTPEPFDNKDKKNWYSATTEEPIEVTTDKIKKLIWAADTFRGTKTDFILINARGEAVLEKIKDKPWFHMKKVTDEQLKEYMDGKPL